MFSVMGVNLPSVVLASDSKMEFKKDIFIEF